LLKSAFRRDKAENSGRSLKGDYFNPVLSRTYY
jgi:hypothetical protein